MPLTKQTTQRSFANVTVAFLTTQVPKTALERMDFISLLVVACLVLACFFICIIVGVTKRKRVPPGSHVVEIRNLDENNDTSHTIPLETSTTSFAAELRPRVQNGAHHPHQHHDPHHHHVTWGRGQITPDTPPPTYSILERDTSFTSYVSQTSSQFEIPPEYDDSVNNTTHVRASLNTTTIPEDSTVDLTDIPKTAPATKMAASATKMAASATKMAASATKMAAPATTTTTTTTTTAINPSAKVHKTKTLPPKSESPFSKGVEGNRVEWKGQSRTNRSRSDLGGSGSGGGGKRREGKQTRDSRYASASSSSSTTATPVATTTPTTPTTPLLTPPPHPSPPLPSSSPPPLSPPSTTTTTMNNFESLHSACHTLPAGSGNRDVPSRLSLPVKVDNTPQRRIVSRHTTDV